MPKCQIFQHQQTPGLAPGKQGAENDQYDLRHDESSFGQGSQENNDSSE